MWVLDFFVEFEHVNAGWNILLSDQSWIYNPGKNIWHKVKKSNKIGQDFKNLLSNFACFMTAIVKI